MGSPHVVVFCERPSAVPLEKVGPVIEHQPIFPNRTNVHFVHVKSPTQAEMRTWERGAGVTMACGTGACAALVAGAITKRLARQARISLPGGDLDVTWNDKTGHILMTGPAT